MTEQQINMAAKLYECRNTCKKIWGSDWKKQIDWHLKVIPAAMKKHGIDNEIEAAMKLINDAGTDDSSGIFTMKILAAAVELIEPSE